MEQYYIIPKNTIDDIENSIQRKRGSDAPIEPSEMPLAIDTIPSSVDGTDVPVGGIYLTKPDGNGNPTEAYIIGYAPVVNYTWGDMLSFTYFPYLRKIEFIGTNNVASIGSYAFYNCTSLTSISLPNGLTSIGDHAFRVCTSLTTINLPASLSSIGSYAFYNCTSLTTINLPNSLTSINSYAFQNCSSLTTINLPASLSSIGSYAFQKCTSLTTINLPTGLSSIGSNAFYSCTSLTTINLPASLSSIAAYTFYDCTSLTTINLPTSLSSIGNSTFQNCTSLTTINLPTSLSSIGSYAFYGCTSLENVSIADGFNCNGLNLAVSTHYSVETMVSWFNALADRTGQTPYTLTIGTTNLNKLTAEQKAIATNKNWTLA